MFAQYLQAIKTALPAKNIISNYLQRFAYGTDASFYRLVPKVVLKVDNEQQLAFIIKQAAQYHIAITFRAAGTSLSGQAITDSVLIILSSQWNKINVLENGEKISCQPGVIGASANVALQPYQRKIGPDPASINSCKIGGIAANNSSGMCCGVKDNSYHTLAGIKLIFADGAVLDSQDKTSIAAFRKSHQSFIAKIEQLAQQVKNNPLLADKIRHKYRLKNTTGYGINALIDFDDVIDIISHLMIGSEGTLAFIADITYHTIKIEPFKATGLYIFDDIEKVCHLVQALANEQVQALEIMDSRALLSVAQQLEQLMPLVKLPSKGAGLLIEFSANSAAELTALLAKISQHVNEFSAHQLCGKAFTSEPAVIDALWKVRKGMFPAVGAVRKTGTTVVIEDIALPLKVLAQGIADLQQLFQQFGYHEAIIFGHALAGNLHFVFTQSFDSDDEVERYQGFMSAVSKMVAVDYQGSLKAEHGTGRNMAPFVELEWGTDLYQVMKQIKSLFDPKNILNPGVIINDDKKAHLRHLKTLPAADEVIDKCIECGFCEAVCPSKDFTLTPRQRIAVWRRIQALTDLEKKQALTTEQKTEHKALKKDYQFFGIDSCAATGLCGQQCPVNIDTGTFIKGLRAKQNSTVKVKLGQFSANHFSSVSKVAKMGLNAVALAEKIVGASVTEKTFKVLNKVTNIQVPLWYSAWPTGADKPGSISPNLTSTNKVIYIPSCANRIFSADKNAQDQRTLPEVLLSIFTKANIELIIPKKIDNLCCGMPWQSKGLADIGNDKQQAFIDTAYQASEHGKWPVITDASPCALTLKGQSEVEAKVAVYEATEFIVQQVLPLLTINKSQEIVMLHKTCSSIKMNSGSYLETLAHHCSDNVTVPQDIHCCGFAGDKGFYLPELNEKALKALKPQIPSGCSRGLSDSRTCEIGLSKHSEISYQSILYLLDEVSQSK